MYICMSVYLSILLFFLLFVLLCLGKWKVFYSFPFVSHFYYTFFTWLFNLWFKVSIMDKKLLLKVTYTDLLNYYYYYYFHAELSEAQGNLICWLFIFLTVWLKCSDFGHSTKFYLALWIMASKSLIYQQVMVQESSLKK